jgi:pimeloyl-ACP methyl ester carboxylesterase
MSLLRLCVDDPVVKELRNLHGANIVRVPNGRISPLLSVADKNGELSVRGELKYLLGDPLALTLKPSTAAVARLTSSKTQAMDLGFGLKVIAGMLNGFGVPLPPIKAALGHATQIRLTFQDVRKRFIDTNELGALLASQTISPKNPAASVYFGKNAHRLLVIDSVIESSSFGIEVVGSTTANTAIDLGALKAIASDELTIAHAGGQQSEIWFEGKRPLAFAFTCLTVELGPTGRIKSLPPGPNDAILERDDRHTLLSAKTGMLAVDPPPASDLEWYEAQNIDSLRDALRDPAGTKARIARAVGEKGLEMLLVPKNLGPTKESAAGITDILFLHGIMGSHLMGDGTRPWFSLPAMFFTKVAERIRVPDAEHLHAGDHLSMFYANARTGWKDRGYDVWPVSYDWRQSLVACADGLHIGIEKLAAQPRADGTPRRIAIVGHSMGGVVASLYASRHPEWAKRIHAAVFMGSPLKGSYAPFEAITGTYPFFEKLDKLALRSSLRDFQETSVGLPGLLGLLPDPSFTDPAQINDLLTATNWPDLIPAQQTLTEVGALQPQISGSPLLERTTLLATITRPTVCSVTMQNGKRVTGPRNGKGDGTVPARSAACVGGAPTYEVTAEHSDIPNEWDAIVATVRILEGETPNLRTIKPEDLDGVLPVTESSDEVVELKMIKGAAEVRARLDAGLETADDVRWLLSSDPDAVPHSPRPAKPTAAKKKRPARRRR